MADAPKISGIVLAGDFAGITDVSFTGKDGLVPRAEIKVHDKYNLVYHSAFVTGDQVPVVRGELAAHQIGDPIMIRVDVKNDKLRYLGIAG